MWSRRVVPKSSRMACGGLLKSSAMPLKSGALDGGVGQRLSSGCTLATARGSGVGNKGRRGLVKVLAEALVVGEQESAVLLDGPAQRAAELVALVRWHDALGEIIGSVKVVVAQEFKQRTVKLVAARLGDDNYLAARALAVFGAVGIAQDIELPHCIDAQQLLAGAARLHIILRRARVLHTIQQEEILLRAIAGDGEIVPRGRIGNSDAARFFLR